MSERVPADEYARRLGFKTSAIIYRIKAGILDGVEEDGTWYVVRTAVRAPTAHARAGNEGGEDEPIVENSQSTGGTEIAHALRRGLREWLAPRYDDLTLFVMSIAATLTFLTHPQLRAQAFGVFEEAHDFRLLIVAGWFLCGLALSVFHATTDREKAEFQRESMLFFAISLQAISALVAGDYLIDAAPPGPHRVFPVWNFLNGLLLLMLYRFRIVDTECIVDGGASPLQLAVALAASYVLVLVGQHVLEYHWALTLSMTVAVASTVSRGVDRVVLAFEE